ncbi:hypothetical protein DL765_002905 [Monosporascus sp. GIB2]|nr:hypothetical protein DL765_002905 [Monosporascus sp. GIB2]
MPSLKSFLLAIAAVAPGAFASPVPGANSTSVVDAAPRWYSGPWYNFPSMGTWRSFDELYNIHSPYMAMTGSTWGDIEKIRTSCLNIGAQYGVDPRIILAMIMQESHGYVGVRTTYSWEGIPTAGLMQCWGCQGYPGRVNLSQQEIDNMVRGGVEHYKGNLRNWGDAMTESCVYPAMREYNSGNVNPNDLSDGRGATPSYVSDVAQRLQGWAD